MGANAQTTVPTFTAGQVLTADQQNQSARTGVPVFATTVERDAAFGGTGEKTLAEGQLCYLESTDVVQYYDGASWATVGPSTPGGLIYVTGATFTAASTISMAAGVFTSTYKSFRVIIQITAGATGGQFNCRVNDAGTPRTAGNYLSASMAAKRGGVYVGADTSTLTSNTSGYIMNFPTSVTGFVVLDVLDPTNASEQTAWTGTAWGVDSGASDNATIKFSGTYNVTEANDGLTFITSAGTVTGLYRVYAYSES
jgi:hypothetical protein